MRYAGLKFYAEPQLLAGGWRASIVLQCRQKPDVMRTQGETMGFTQHRGYALETLGSTPCLPPSLPPSLPTCLPVCLPPFA